MELSRHSIWMLLIMSTHEFDAARLFLRNTDVSSNIFGSRAPDVRRTEKLIEIFPQKHTNVSCVYTARFAYCTHFDMRRTNSFTLSFVCFGLEYYEEHAG